MIYQMNKSKSEKLTGFVTSAVFGTKLSVLCIGRFTSGERKMSPYWEPNTDASGISPVA
jgi:hypothetical protein